MIKIWNKHDININSYSFINTVFLNSTPYDLLLLNDEYFVSSQPFDKAISFIAINSLSIQKTLINVDCIKSNNCLFLFKGYLLINCKNGIAVVSITKRKYFNILKIILRI